MRLLSQETGVDFHQYKPTTLRRRLLQRMNLLNIASEEAYLSYLELHEQEKNLLFRQLLIHVTNFFRDAPAFTHLCADIIPAILATKTAGEPLRIWVCGCASGEEAYSVAICLHEHAGESFDMAGCRVFASDLSPQMIARARKAVYAPAALTDLSPERRDRYFKPYSGGFQVIDHIRDMCLFVRHNVLADPPFAHLDLVSCRNMLIYMQPVLQKRVLDTFSLSLKQNGILFLGKSETCSGTTYFDTLNKSFNTYVNKRRCQDLSFNQPRFYQNSYTMSMGDKPTPFEKKDFQKAADELVLSRYVPSGVVVDEKLDIVDFRGNTGFYIDPSPGVASLNVLKMVRKGLYYDLQDALLIVAAENAPFKKEGIALEHEGKLLRINLEIQPLAGLQQKYLLILFHLVQPPAALQDGLPEGDHALRLRIHQLEQELLESRDQLRALGEEQEATNEEYQSANEELKTLNEELQTSQEELITLNDELTNRNAKLHELNKEVTLSRDFADSIYNTVSESVLVLDKSLRLKSANRSFYETFQVTPEETLGNLVYELGNGQWNIPALRTMLENILPHKAIISSFEMSHDFPVIGKRTMCLNARQVEGGIEKEPLIFLAIDDITEKKQVALQLKKKQDELFVLEERQRLAIDATNICTWDYAPATEELVLSENGAALTGIPQTGQLSFPTIIDAIHPDDQAAVTQAFDEMIHGSKERMEVECRIKSTAEQPARYVVIMAKALKLADEVTRISGIISDITERKTAQVLLQKAFTSLEFALGTGNIGSWELDTENFVLTGSSAFQLNFGLPADAAISYEEWLQRIVEADREQVKHALEHAIDNKETFRQEYRVSWPDETIHWLSSTGKALYTETGRPERMSGVTADITDRKSAEQKLQYSEQHFRSLSNSAPVMIAMSNAQNQFEFYNQEWLLFTGRSNSSRKGNWEDDVHPDDVAALVQVREEASKKYSRFSTEFRMRNKGRYHWVSAVSMPRFGPGNKFAGYTVACTDIHDRHMIAEELERKVHERTIALKDLNHELLERNQELEQFAFVTSHDLQEPLRKIRMYISMLVSKDDRKNDFLTNYLHKIEAAAIRMIGLIQDLLNYSSLKDKASEFVPTDLNKSVQSVLLDFDLLIQEKEATITLGHLPVVDAVPLQINQLFYNLISNALKFVPAGRKPLIEITSSPLPPEDLGAHQLNGDLQYVRINVRDNGIGFDDQYAETIFGLFQRLNNRENYAGNGIGLALCKRIALNHNGRIIPHSKENEGTSFEIILPLNQKD